LIRFLFKRATFVKSVVLISASGCGEIQARLLTQKTGDGSTPSPALFSVA
jgi:hypothetical protein